ncbi:MAG TPA: ABC transporter ATP-binding protein [Xanthobacteraceae bacterium]|nr:ABC transporter ATP-binding protein [Xanthobacteraceae bacterium]
MPEALLATRQLRKRFGGLVATDDVSVEILPGEIHAVIGPNGAGKTTLIAQLAGDLQPDSGAILFAGQDVTGLTAADRVRRGLARSFQITNVFREFSALDNVSLAVQASAGHSFHFWRSARRDPALREPAETLLAELGLSARLGVAAGNLSHSEKRTLEIAMVLASKPRLVLLDEPLAGMAPEDSKRMVQRLAALKGKVTILLIEHDMDAVFALADRLTVLVYGRAIATGTPDVVRANEAVQRAYFGDEAE